jgi:predicted GH43/DUF377 family glycosyl hydrolase
MNRMIFAPLFLLVSFQNADANEAKLTVLLNAKGEHESAPHGEGNIYAPCVLIDGGIWKMWYGGQGKDGHDRILYAESKDGRQWERKGVALEDNTANHINDPSIVKVGDSYFMYFTRAEKFVIDRIHVATSDDGLKWKVIGIALSAGKKDAWDSLSVGRPSVIHDEGMFKMWYDGRKDFPVGAPVEGLPVSNESHRFVGYATSKDGINWVRKSDEPVFGNDAGGIDVQRIRSKYIMAYESHDGTRCAKSDDGVNWKDTGYLLRKSGGEADRHGHVTPFLFIHEQHELRLFFGAARAATWDRNVIASSPFVLD